MLTKRQNLLETIRGGKPDRFVNRFEAFALITGGPPNIHRPIMKPGMEIVNEWGVTIRFKEGQPGPFPVHDEEHKVLKDITQWKKYVKAPHLEDSPEVWQDAKAQAEAVDRSEQFVTWFAFPGIFEQLHYLMGMEDTLINFYEEPEYMHELIDYITEWKLEYARLVCKYVQPEALFHHDDWGTQISSFLSPQMFAEFIAPYFKRIYSYYKENGCELIIHHSDSYAANLVPSMIDMGIDIWQGCMSTNNTPELIRKYGGQISFMGDIDNGVVDVPDWTPELIAREVERACRNCGKLYFIPCTTMGGPESTHPGVYEAVGKEIERMSRIMFG